MKIKGQISKIIYNNKDFWIFSVNSRVKAKYTGSFILKKGITIEMEGEFFNDSKYGDVFIAQAIEKSEAIQKKINLLPYFIDGVGEKKALEIEKKLGPHYLHLLSEEPKLILDFYLNQKAKQIKEQCLQIKEDLLKQDLTHLPHYLSKHIKGLGIKKATEWIQLEENRFYEDLEVSISHFFGSDTISSIYEQFLHLKELLETKEKLIDFGYSEKITLNLIQKYKLMTLNEIQTNPYLPIKEGMNFLTCDQIALKHFHFEKDSMHRIIYAVIHIIKESEADGNTYLNLHSAIEQTSVLLDLNDKDYIHDIILMNTQFEDAEFVLEEDMLYRRIIYFTEKKIARLIKSFIHANSLSTNGIMHIQNSYLAESQKKAITGVLSNRLSILTGGPGTGKTTCVKVICEVIKKMNKHFTLCSPTGRAAKRLSESTGEVARTIHRVLEYKQLGPIGKFMKNEQFPLDTDYLIVDESSMLDVYLINSLLKALKPHASIIFVGDVDQLPSIQMGSILKDLKESGVVPVFELTEVFRQSQESLINLNAYRIKQGLPLEIKKSSDFAFLEFDDKNQLLSKLKQIASRNHDFQVLCPMKSGALGVDQINCFLQSEFNPAKTNQKQLFLDKKLFREEDHVIQLSNDYYKEIYNGEIGIVKHIQEDKMVVFYPNNEVERIEYKMKDLRNIDLSYAITIHKSQGSEFNNVVIILENNSEFITKELFYTGLTRAKQKLIILSLIPKNEVDHFQPCTLRATNLKKLLQVNG